MGEFGKIFTRLMTHLEGTFYWSHDVTYKMGRKKRKEVY